ncbi:MAG: hypothetical protein LC797_10440, partial [Chloroflexi bacterium]|nr:hypothetical protein [Chloroflexota bacterium]
MATATVHSQPSAYADGRVAAVYLGPSLMAAAGVEVGDFVRISTRRGRVVVGRIADSLAAEAGEAI